MCKQAWTCLASPPKAHYGFDHVDELQGFEPFGILSKAASGIASTTTTMATTLDEAMENFFEGWTPAPPAADHTSFHSPYHRYQSHGSTAASQSTGKMALSARPEEAAALPSNQKHEVNDDWEEWESPFHSKSASPNVENQDPNDNEQAGNGISAWHGCSPDHGHSEAQPVAMRGTTGGQKHRSSIEDTSLHALPRYSLFIVGLLLGIMSDMVSRSLCIAACWGWITVHDVRHLV